MYGFISYRMINSCKPDCPGRLPSCHASCEEYRRARAEADAIAAKANKQKFIDNAADELKSKNKNRYGE